MALSPDDFALLYAGFSASISKYDCGRKCAPLNNGYPVCCSTQDAVPVVDRAEWKLLQSRTDLWKRFKPYDHPTRKIVEELHHGCCAIECKGVAHCERDNRTIACRAFPFFPYLTREKKLLGLSVYWGFTDRCWMISNMQIVERDFVREFVDTFEKIFAKDKTEFDTYVRFSADMRRQFSRMKKTIPVLAADDGRLLIVTPKTGAVREGRKGEHPKYAPFTSDAAYARAIRAEKGSVPAEGLRPV